MQAIQLVSMKLYDWFMIAIILGNMVVLAMSSSEPGFDVGGAPCKRSTRHAHMHVHRGAHGGLGVRKLTAIEA